jgi:Protein of unknown function (DUF3221)
MPRRLVLAILVLAVSACGGGDTDPLGLPSRQPDFTGEVRDRGADGRILVVPKGDPCGYWVAADEANVVDVDVQIEPEAIERGWRARVWIDGPIAESCPGQTSAEAVEILPR